MKTNWPTAPINELCVRVTSGGTPSRSNPAYYSEGTIPWIKTGDLDGWYVDEISERITPQAIQESSAKIFPADTVLLAMYGDGKTMGSVGLIRSPAATNQACCAMLADPEKCNPKFLLYSLVYFRPAILKLAISGAQRNLNGKSIKEFSIGAPPVTTQRRIASILSAYDDLIENNTRRIAILEEMARRLYEEWFVRFRFPGHEDVRMVESELGLVPEGWHVLPLGETVADIVDYRGKTPAKLGGEWECEGVPAISALNVKGGRLVNLEKSRCVNEDLYKRWMKNPLQKGDILMTSEAPLGELHLLQRSTRYCLSQRLYSIRAEYKMLTPALLYLTLDSQRTQSELASRATGATVAGIRQSELRKIPILIPPREVQSAIGPLVEQLLAQRSTLDEINTNLRTTRDLLLPKLISGELDVSTLPDPEAVAA